MVRLKILIVDDSYLEIKVIKDILQEDYEVYHRTSGETVVETVIAKKIDLILLDIIMPGPDGYMVCQQLKRNPLTKNIPIIFLTGRGELVDQIKGLEVGAIDYIIKPVHPLIIKARIKNHLEIKQYQDILTSLSFLDGLTDIANRRHFDDVLDKEWKLACRSNGYLSILLADIDFFKNYNDFYGHLQGDDCLKLVAAAIENSATRPTDLVARYGGEEFIILLPLTEGKGAIKVAKAVQKNINALKIPHAKSAISKFLTVSIGSATIRPSKQVNPKQFLDLADQALYIAKGKGRNMLYTLG